MQNLAGFCSSSTKYGMGRRKFYPSVWNYFEVYWSRARGLSAVNAVGTQLRDPINYNIIGTNPMTADGKCGRRREQREGSRKKAAPDSA